MPIIRLIRAVLEPGDRGPSRGMHALGKALRQADFPWLKIGGTLADDEIPWIWSWQDARMAAWYAAQGRPFVLGPNVLFGDSARPGAAPHEEQLLQAASCAALFTESPWYVRLLQANLRGNRAPISIFSYPIDPLPEGPLPAEFEVLVYYKSQGLGAAAEQTLRNWPPAILVKYGAYQREWFLSMARRARAIAYLCDDDRGPLAAAEAALCGCPLVGIERGCPWVLEHGLGVAIENFGQLQDGIQQALRMDRAAVRRAALERFAAARSVAAIRAALEPLAEGRA